MKILVFILFTIFSQGCDNDVPSPIENFNNDFAVLQCDGVFYCCEDHGGIILLEYESYSECISGYRQILNSSFNSHNFDIIEENLPFLLEKYEILYAKGCNYQISYNEQKEIDDLIYNTFSGKKQTGDSCDDDLECTRGNTCVYDLDSSRTCVQTVSEGESCMDADCDRGLFCISLTTSVLDIGRKCYAPMLEGEACVNNQCAGDLVFCNEDTQLCEAVRNPGEPCASNNYCESRICTDANICDDRRTLIEQYCKN